MLARLYNISEVDLARDFQLSQFSSIGGIVLMPAFEAMLTHIRITQPICDILALRVPNLTTRQINDLLKGLIGPQVQRPPEHTELVGVLYSQVGQPWAHCTTLSMCSGPGVHPATGFCRSGKSHCRGWHFREYRTPFTCTGRRCAES